MRDEPPLLELQRAQRWFGTGDATTKALDGVDLTVHRGQSLAITGRSGSGKSTMLGVLGLLDGLTGGRYLIDGADTATLPERDLTALRARTFGFVFQSFHLVPYLSVRENVELGLTYDRSVFRARRGVVEHLVEQVGLAHRSDAAVATLSGGEKQRTAVARALVRDPAVVLADEPTGNLDEANAAAILDLFDAVARSGVAVVVVTHDPAAARRAQTTATMRDGRLT